MLTALAAYCAAQNDWLLQTIEALVRRESPSTDKAAVDRCGAELQARLAAIGAAVSRADGGHRGDHLVAEFDGSGPHVLLLGHFDTVWEVGQLERMPLVHDRATGRLHGPGVFDMKSGIAVAMLAVRALEALSVEPRPRITMLWTSDEEVGSGTSRTLVESLARQSQAVLVLEPSLPGGAAKTARKGVGEFEIVAHGIAAHAGLDPDKGASAIHELAHQIVAIESLRDRDRGVTVNVGTIAGGSRTNVVADLASATVDVRVQTMADAAAVAARMAGLRPVFGGTRVEVRGGINRPPLERTPAVARLLAMAQAVARDLGRDLGEGSAGGASDGNFTAGLGVPTLDGLGPQGDGAHALHEHVVVADLSWRAALIAGLLGLLASDRARRSPA